MLALVFVGLLSATVGCHKDTKKDPQPNQPPAEQPHYPPAQ
jgi:hypothetical protein